MLALSLNNKGQCDVILLDFSMHEAFDRVYLPHHHLILKFKYCAWPVLKSLDSIFCTQQVICGG